MIVFVVIVMMVSFAHRVGSESDRSRVARSNRILRQSKQPEARHRAATRVGFAVASLDEAPRPRPARPVATIAPQLGPDRYAIRPGRSARGVRDRLPSSVREAWERCIAPATRDSGARWRSRLCLRTFARDHERLARFEREARRSRRSTIPTSPPFSALSARRSSVPRHGAGRGRGPRDAHRARAIPLDEALPLSSRSPRDSRRAPRRASSIATSSRRTSRSDPRAGQDSRLRTREGDGDERSGRVPRLAAAPVRSATSPIRPR